MWYPRFNQPRDRKIASLLALAGAVSPVTGLHKFYLRQPVWGVVYLLLSWTPIPRVASGIEAVWYLFQDGHEFDQRFNQGLPLTAQSSGTPTAPPIDPEHVGAIAEALRKLDELRTEGLLSEYEFEQKRRQLLDKIS
jgi:TM2 domain-containing membrane protein YozV